MVQSLRLYHFYCPNEAVWASGSSTTIKIIVDALHNIVYNEDN